METVTTTVSGARNYGNIAGYQMADQIDINDIVTRLNTIETEIWNPYDNAKQRYQQSVRYRLFHAEDRLDAMDTLLANHETRIT